MSSIRTNHIRKFNASPPSVIVLLFFPLLPLPYAQDGLLSLSAATAGPSKANNLCHS